MAKQLTFEYEGQQYTLEYTRKSVESMESQGFILRSVDDIPITIIPALFAGSFLAHHRFIKQPLIEEIYKKMPDKVELIRLLAEMYMEPIVALFEDPEEEEGNVRWGANW